MTKQADKHNLFNILEAVRNNPSSWQNWSCINISYEGTINEKVFIERAECVRSVLDSYFATVEYRLFFCKNQEIHLFCKQISESVLEQASDLIYEALAEKVETPITCRVFNLGNKGRSYADAVLSCLSAENVNAHSSIDRGIDDGYLYAFENENHIMRMTVDTCDRIKVLLVEDDPVTRWIVRRTLKNQCDFATAPTANQSFAQFSSFQPDIVFLDIDLPDQSGQEVLKWMMHNDPGANVVMFSGNNSMHHISTALEDGARGFITKPFLKEDLLQYVQECMN